MGCRGWVGLPLPRAGDHGGYWISQPIHGAQGRGIETPPVLGAHTLSLLTEHFSTPPKSKPHAQQLLPPRPGCVPPPRTHLWGRLPGTGSCSTWSLGSGFFLGACLLGSPAVAGLGPSFLLYDQIRFPGATCCTRHGRGPACGRLGRLPLQRQQMSCWNARLVSCCIPGNDLTGPLGGGVSAFHSWGPAGGFPHRLRHSAPAPPAGGSPLPLCSASLLFPFFPSVFALFSLCVLCFFKTVFI